MGTNCAPLVADLFLFCHERDFMLSLSLLNIDNNFFVSMVNRIYPSELQASFLDLHLSTSDGFIKTKLYDERDDFNFDIVNFHF